MQTTKLSFACPVCSSTEVFYSCTPNCCFNHVCGDCGTTFEPATRRKGRSLVGVIPPNPLPDATDPTAGCAACDSTAVYQLPEGDAVCAKCGAVLEIEYTEIAPG